MWQKIGKTPAKQRYKDKSECLRRKPERRRDVKSIVEEVLAAMGEEALRSATNHLAKRVQCCIKVLGDHIKQLLRKSDML